MRIRIDLNKKFSRLRGAVEFSSNRHGLNRVLPYVKYDNKTYLQVGFKDEEGFMDAMNDLSDAFDEDTARYIFTSENPYLVWIPEKFIDSDKENGYRTIIED